MNEHILISQANGLCELHLNRPDKRNALTLAMYGALTDGLQAAARDDTVRVVLLSGAGASFTSGNDLGDFLNGPDMDGAHNVVRFLQALAAFPKVVIAAVHGQTVGIGVTMLLHCDLVVAARGTHLTMPFVKLGLVPEAASSLLLPRLIGPQRAAELLLLGKTLDASAALELGMVNKVVEEDVLMDEARSLARAVADQPGSAVLATKRLLRREPEAISARIDAEVEAFAAQLQSVEFKAAAQAFLAKRRDR